MSSESWISRVKLRKKQKQVIKLRNKFSFLIDELKESEDRVIARVTYETESRISSRIDKRIQKINNSVDKAVDSLQESISDLQGKFVELRTQYDDDTSVMLKKVRSAITKIEKAESNISAIQKNNEFVVKDNAKNIVLSLEEVKSLLQLLAVNNLLDEIDVKEIKK